MITALHKKCSKIEKNTNISFVKLCKCQLLKVVKTISYRKLLNLTNYQVSEPCENLLQHLISCLFSHTLTTFSQWESRKTNHFCWFSKPQGQILIKITHLCGSKYSCRDWWINKCYNFCLWENIYWYRGTMPKEWVHSYRAS